MIIPFEGPLDLASTLESGQAFRWRRESEGWFRGVVFGSLVFLRHAPGGIEMRAYPGPEASLASKVCDYLRLGDDLPAIYAAIGRDDTMRAAIAGYYGMRLLRQEPWECLAAFICSANSNIPRIMSNVEAMSRKLGALSTCEAGEFCAFPEPQAIAEAGEGTLRALGLGFRAPYVARAAAMVASGALALEPLRRASYNEAKAALLEVPGVGPKVADCVLLFALDKLDAFPVDRWVRRAVEEAYFGGNTLKYADIRTWALEYFGPYAGYAEQYLFHGKRLGARGE